MAHFAKVVDGLVTEVIVAEQDFIDNHCTGTWLQTSYNTRNNVHYGQDGEPDGGVALRGNYASIGYSYDSSNDVFYPPKPFASWTIDTSTWSWESPIALPTNEPSKYYWDEDAYQADNTTGWVEYDD